MNDYCCSSCRRLRPHVVFMMIDDMGFDDFVLAKDIAWTETRKVLPDSILVNSTYTECLCSPSRSAFMTGRYLHQQEWAWGNWGYFSSQSEVTLAQKMNAQNYVSYAVGKMHIGGSTWEMTPTGRGFARFRGIYHNTDHFLYCKYEHDLPHGGAPGDNNDPTYRYVAFDLHYEESMEFECSGATPMTPAHRFESRYIGQYSTNLLHDTAIQFLREHKTKFSGPEWRPLFMYYATYALHLPLEANQSDYGPCPESLFTGPKADLRRNICAMAVGLDKSIGKLTTEMQTLFPDDNYVLIVTSDNGGYIGSAGGGSNYPLRGGKSGLNEGGVRNNALIWGKHPDLERSSVKGKVYTGGFMHLVDWHMTVAHLGHATPYDEWNPADLASVPSDGLNIWEAVTSNGPSPRNEVGLINSYLGWSTRNGKFKVVWDPVRGFRDPPLEDIPQDSKCARQSRSDGVRMFNIDDDPRELCDLAVSDAATADALKASVEQTVQAATISNGLDSFFIFEGDCDQVSAPLYNRVDGTCAEWPFNACCNDIKSHEKDKWSEWGASVPNNKCNDKHIPAAEGTVYAAKPFWESFGNRRRTGGAKQAIECAEPPF